MDTLMNFRMIFLSIVIEALPFLLVGVIVSAIINNFVSENVIRRLLPKRKLSGILSASLLGLVFPICECGVVPITGRLIKKGLPLSTAIAFMLASPVINPVVALSTAAAFNGSWLIAGFRLGLALIVTITACLLIGFFFDRQSVILHPGSHASNEHACTAKTSAGNKVASIFTDSCSEFFAMGKYFLFGAFLSALAQTLIPYNSIVGVGQHSIASILAMMAFAFGISVCSTSDAFIAASFAGTFTFGSLLAFMVLGPMADLKNSLMLFHVFPIRLVVLLIALTAVLCGIGAYSINLLLAGG